MCSCVSTFDLRSYKNEATRVYDGMRCQLTIGSTEFVQTRMVVCSQYPDEGDQVLRGGIEIDPWCAAT